MDMDMDMGVVRDAVLSLLDHHQLLVAKGRGGAEADLAVRQAIADHSTALRGLLQLNTDPSLPGQIARMANPVLAGCHKPDS